MNRSGYNRVSAAIFALVALMHLWIAMTGSVMTINGTELGIWVNYLAFVVTGYMAITAYSFKK